MARPDLADDLEVVLRGDLPADIAGYARSRISRLGDYINEPVRQSRIRLTHEPDPAIERPVRAQANLFLKGRAVRAQVAGRSAREAVDLLTDRLRRGLERGSPDWEARRTSRLDGPAEPHEWRHDAPRAERPPYYPRPVEERQVIRHKSFTPRRISPTEAAVEMDQLDYDFHLFTDVETAHDAVVFRDRDGAYHLSRVGHGPPPSFKDRMIRLGAQPVPRLALDEARRHLELAGLPFLFFVDRATGRGAVLYHRYDGHYGLIAPA